MFYNIRNNTILNVVPLNGYFDDGTLVQGLDTMDHSTQKLCGILPILSDSPEQPANTIENIDARQVVIHKNGVDIIRTWIEKPLDPIVVPEVISPRQIRLWFIQNNIPLSSVENAIASIEDDIVRETTQVEWEYSPYVERNHPMINTLGSVLGLSPEQIDQAFIQASVL